ncbi:hypothetical protein BVY01_03170 [bacterium I07]|nr:hypothetical protein BVY01_03170 [bacterium I07]
MNSIEKQSKPRTLADRTLVLGLGNTILSDDGVGIYVTRLLQNRIDKKDVSFKEASMGGLELLDLMSGFHRVILIDAVQSGKVDVGTVVHMNIKDISGGSAMARHQVSLWEALELGKQMKMDLPAEIMIYGIEVQDILTFGESCTEALTDRLPSIVEHIINREFD